ncbi:hypothetical protein EN45_041650 [Penicillium chrysogenum]|uniref:Uncharacterized protein n=1 Tax=Penicillium chrysogenum TaxID=5076 RepID=A0A161ZN05_PENCH|nr:hypothetical protein EN45_041650 [Penicillium chrysogenum]
MAKFGSQETPELCFGGSEETQAEDINDIQRKELHDQHGGASHSDDRFTNDSTILSEGPTTPQIPPPHQTLPGQTFHQQPVHPLVLWKLMAPFHRTSRVPFKVSGAW